MLAEVANQREAMIFKCLPKREGNIGNFLDPRTAELDRDTGISSHEAHDYESLAQPDQPFDLQ